MTKIYCEQLDCESNEDQQCTQEKLYLTPSGDYGWEEGIPLLCRAYKQDWQKAQTERLISGVTDGHKLKM